MQQEEMMPADDTQTQEDEMEGSGNDPQMEPVEPAQPGLMTRVSINKK